LIAPLGGLGDGVAEQFGFEAHLVGGGERALDEVQVGGGDGGDARQAEGVGVVQQAARARVGRTPRADDQAVEGQRHQT